ncbi:MAG: hypothetical protein ACRD30_06290 [Bryobacteraceae bacterium]
MNLVLLLIVIAEICFGICAWISPAALRWTAALLLTRADVIEAAKQERSRRLRFWQNELGVEQPGRPREHRDVRAMVPRS